MHVIRFPLVFATRESCRRTSAVSYARHPVRTTRRFFAYARKFFSRYAAVSSMSTSRRSVVCMLFWFPLRDGPVFAQAQCRMHVIQSYVFMLRDGLVDVEA